MLYWGSLARRLGAVKPDTALPHISSIHGRVRALHSGEPRGSTKVVVVGGRHIFNVLRCLASDCRILPAMVLPLCLYITKFETNSSIYLP
jgi:hypothetical protein